MIKFDRVSKLYPEGSRALADVSFTIERGTMVFLTGHSGAGKSTLLRLMGGTLRPSTGEVEVSGRVAALELGLRFSSEFTGRPSLT